MKNISNYFSSKILLPNLMYNCRIYSPAIESSINIGKVYLFEKNVYLNIYAIENEYTDEIIYIGTNITGYFNLKDWHDTIPNSVDISGKNSLGTEMIIKNIFITKDTRSMKDKKFNRYIQFVASKIVQRKDI